MTTLSIVVTKIGTKHAHMIFNLCVQYGAPAACGPSEIKMWNPLLPFLAHLSTEAWHPIAARLDNELKSL
jgi:hypothetical protein